ncbi:MAG TPA: 1-deoxy-D-xylulose-5-phosphate synthase, partial [Clostridia bacterium]|nr:1-deoxy-D-xylulose-5-phosphate synthase [Clostridia bacterium]
KKVFRNAKNIKGPVLVHVVTKKGKGYKPAEENPDKFHGIGPFDVATGIPYKKNKAPTYTEVFGQTMLELAKNNHKLIGITAAMVDGTGLKPFAQKYPERFFDVGIAEQHAVTFAAGLAANGLRPVVAIYSSFFQRAYDQIIHDVCLQNLPVVFVIDRGGLVGEDGPTHHGVFDYSYLRIIPNITLMAPKDENELRNMLYTAINFPGPIAIRYPRGNGYGVDLDTDFHLVENKIELLRPGRDLALIAIGSMVYPASEAAQILANEGIEVAVINARYIKPLDKDGIINIAKKIGRIITIEENTLLGGFGSSVLELLSENGLSQCILDRLGIPDYFIEHGDRFSLLEKCGLTANIIVQKVKSYLNKEDIKHNYYVKASK